MTENFHFQLEKLGFHIQQRLYIGYKITGVNRICLKLRQQFLQHLKSL